MNCLSELRELRDALKQINNREFQDFITAGRAMLATRQRAGTGIVAGGVVIMLVPAGRDLSAQSNIELAKSRGCKLICIWQGKCPESTEQFLHFGVEAKTVIAFAPVVNLIYTCLKDGHNEQITTKGIAIGEANRPDQGGTESSRSGTTPRMAEEGLDSAVRPHEAGNAEASPPGD